MQNNWPAVPFTPSDRVIASRYHLGQSLGTGAVGEVFYAQDWKFDPPRPVALKLIHPEVAADLQTREDIKKEASNTARFNHPNILRAIDFDIEPDQAYIVTELATGGSLADKIRPNRDEPPQPLKIEDVARYLEQIALALDEAHYQGLVHRDIKPQNILLDKDDRILLADFGLATSVSGNKMIRIDPWGTAEYAAPEIWKGKVGKASDIYALGAVVYEMLSGQPPFVAGPNQTLEVMHRSAKPLSLSKKLDNPSFPSALDAVVLAALQKDPLRRPKTAGEFYQNFQKALNSLPAPIASAGNTRVTPRDIFLPRIKGKGSALKFVSFLPLIIGLLVIGIIATMNFSTTKTRSSSSSSVTSRNTPTTKASPTPPSKVSLAPVPAITPITFYGDVFNIESLALSPDGKTLATGAQDGTVRLWSMDGRSLAVLTGHYGGVQSLNWSPDGKTLASASADKTVRLWNVEGKALATLEGHKDSVWAVNWSPDGKTLASAGLDNTIRLWKADGTALSTLPIPFIQYSAVMIAWSPDSKILASPSSDKTVRLWQADGTPLATLSGHTADVVNLAWSPDGKTLASASFDKTIRLWSSDGKSLNTLNGHTNLVWSVSWSPDGKSLVSTGADNTIRFWATDGKLLNTLTGHKDTVWVVNWSPDGKNFASVSRDSTVVVWTADGKALYTIPTTARLIRNVVWSSDSKSLVAVSADEKTLRLWKLQP